ncbi:MAG: glutamine-hydrolyzing carbamoyl-phosphate synthase small subunit [Opitutales bacterium]|nr:glutamine-hydrolyzing carbamoyl-phosphate synthase small subunit [Opitutales bacterium]
MAEIVNYNSLEWRSGVLALEDGSVFRGRAFGATATVLGEAVFNTAMTGYQEVITDPSYTGQIITMTTPQIGNYGINPEDVESDGVKVAGFVVRDLSPIASNWRSRISLPDYLSQYGVPGLTGVDTRAITKKLRVTGAMNACLSTEDISDEEAVAKARAWEGIVGIDYVKLVSAKSIYKWDASMGDPTPFTVPGTLLEPSVLERKRYHVVALDFGAKYNIFRKLSYHGFDVTVVPADTPAEAIKELKPQGIFLSNGPGDPDPLIYAHKTAAELIQHYPTFGICMGNHILTHALGAKTFKLKFGHRGANQPVKNLITGKVSITSQNHGFAATPEDLANRGAEVTEINLNDGTVEGLRHKDLPVFSVQYHPEASPGPHDSDPLFEEFYQLVDKHA